jgi:predicted Zn-dependent protease
MRRRLNLKALLVLLAITAVVGGTIVVVHRKQVGQNTRALLDRADRAKAANDLSKEIDYLRRYLGFAPNDHEALTRYANLLASPQVATTLRARMVAIQTLERLLRRAPDQREERRLLVDLYLRVQQFNQASAHLKILLVGESGATIEDSDLLAAISGATRQKQSDDGELLGLQGLCLQGRNKFRDARLAYETAIQLAPHEVANYSRLALLLRQHGSDVVRKQNKKQETPADLVRTADDVIDRLVQVNTTDFRAFLVCASYRQSYPRLTRPEDADKERAAVAAAFERAYQLAPDNAEVMLAWADQTARRGEIEQARSLFAQASRKHPTDFRIYQSLAILERRVQKPENAIRALRDGLTQVPEQPDLLWDLAELHVDRRERKEAESVLTRLQRLGVPQPELDFLRGRLLVAEGRWREATRHLEQTYPRLLGRREQGRDSFINQLVLQCGLLLGTCYARLGDADRSFAAYSRVAALDPRSVPARLGMAEARRNMGQITDAINQYRTLMRLPGASLIHWVDHARLVLMRNFDREQPNWDEVMDAIAQAERLRPLPDEVVLLRLEALAMQKKYDEARAYLQSVVLRSRFVLPAGGPQILTSAALLQNKLPVTYYLASAALEELEGRQSRALEFYDRAEADLGPLLVLRLARIAYWSRQGGPRALEALDKLAQGRDTLKPDEKRQILGTLAIAYRRLDRRDESKRYWTELSQLRKDDLLCRYALFELSLESDNDSGMTEQIQQMKRIEGEDGVLWRHGLVSQLLQRAKNKETDRDSILTEARTHLDALSVRRSNWSQVSVSEAQLQDLAGKTDLALTRYLEAIERGERRLTILRRAVELLYSRQRYREAYELLRKLPREAPLGGDLQRVAAEISLQVRDLTQALKLAQSAVDKGSEDYRDYLWLGQIYWAARQPEQAGPHLKQARVLAPKEPDPWVTLVLYLVSMGKTEEATKETLDAEKTLPTGSWLALAQCFEAIGQQDKARKNYNEALARKRADIQTKRVVAAYYLRSGQNKEAEKLLGELDRPDVRQKNPETAAWARRLKVVLAVLRGNHQEATKALASLGGLSRFSNEDDEKPSLQDQRLRASLLAVRQNRSNRRQAIAILEDIVRQRNATPEDRLLLARLFEADGKWPQAYQQYQLLVGQPGGDNPEFLARYSQSLLRRGMTDEAQTIINQLARTDSNRLLARELKARLMHKQGKTDEAVALLKELASEKEVNRVALAGLLESMGALADAETLYRLHVGRSSEPQAVFVLVGFLARHRRLREAFDLCDRAAKTCPPDEVLQAALMTLSRAPQDAQARERVETLLRGLRAKFPPLVHKLAEANILTVAGKSREAESAYRQILVSDPNNGVALNNLAYLLALTGKGKEALAVVEKGIEMHGPLPKLLETQALAYLADRQETKALPILQELEQDAPSPTVLFHLAQAYQQAKQKSVALKTFLKAKEDGLKPADLHPLEQSSFARLQQALGVE